MVIAVVTAVVWLLTELIGWQDSASISMGFIPARWSGAVGIGPSVPAFLTPLSATLVHAGLLHLAMNLLILVWCGNLVERALGRGALILLYAVGAFAAAAAQWIVEPMSMIPAIGASGAVSAVIGAFALSFGQQKRLVRSPGLNRTLNVAWLLAAWVVLQLLTAWAMGLYGVMLAVPAHIGGFVAGLLLQRPLLLWRYRNA